jgi:hypothetical protein
MPSLFSHPKFLLFSQIENEANAKVVPGKRGPARFSSIQLLDS